MYILMLKQFAKSKSSLLGLGLIFSLGIISIVIGKKFLDEQQQASSKVLEEQVAHVERNIELHKDDIGLLFYYLKFTLVNDPLPLAGLSLGQKDVNPNMLRVTILTLEGQKHDTELVNPVNLLYGNLDLGFLTIYIFPLFIIAFTYNLYSREEETGTWRIVGVMAGSKGKYMLMKLAVRASLILILVGLLYLLAAFFLSIPLDQTYIAFTCMGIVYLLFWFSLSFWVVTLKKNSNVNALALLSIWLLLVVLLPATINNYVTNKYPVPEALTTIIKQRDGYHEKWDTNKRETMKKFYARYPQFTSYGFPPEEGFSWLWYYGMQHLGDEESLQESTEMKKKILARQKTSTKWASFIPPMHIQLSLNRLAGTDLDNHMDFLDFVTEFHEEVRLFYYSHIFSDDNALQVDWDRTKPAYFSQKQEVNWFQSILPLLIPFLLFTFLAYWNRWK